MDRSIRLDLGAGDKKEDGWIRVDVRNDGGRIQPDVQADITQPLPFPNDYADEARAIHVIEHFLPWQVQGIVNEWVRVLKPGGRLIIECPDIEKVLALARVPGISPRYTFWALYGDPTHESVEMLHRWCYAAPQIARIMQNAGLVDIGVGPAQFHEPVRDMRLEGVKPLDKPRILTAKDLD